MVIFRWWVFGYLVYAVLLKFPRIKSKAQEIGKLIIIQQDKLLLLCFSSSTLAPGDTISRNDWRLLLSPPVHLLCSPYFQA